MKDYQQRVVDEKHDLDVKLLALTEFLKNKDKIKTLRTVEHERLVRQAGIMQNYSNVLDERITAFN